MKSALLFVFLFAVNTNVHAQNGELLQIGIYYNSLCADTSRFITDQFLPAFELLSDLIDVFFIPFGKSFWVDHGEFFMCQFGPDDCYGNMLQLCGLSQICRDEQAQVDFVACEMQLPFNRNATRPECSERAGIDWEEVELCIENGLGRELKLDAQRRTHRVARPYPLFVPAIVYNGVFNQTLQNRSLNEFFYVVCELTGSDNPSCPGQGKL